MTNATTSATSRFVNQFRVLNPRISGPRAGRHVILRPEAAPLAHRRGESLPGSGGMKFSGRRIRPSSPFPVPIATHARSPPRPAAVQARRRRRDPAQGLVQPPLGQRPQEMPRRIVEPAAGGVERPQFVGRHRLARLGLPPPFFSPRRRSDPFFLLVLPFGRNGFAPPATFGCAPGARGVAPLPPGQDQLPPGRVIGRPLGDPPRRLQSGQAQLDAAAALAQVPRQRLDRRPAGGLRPRVEQEGPHQPHVGIGQPGVPDQIVRDRRKRRATRPLPSGRAWRTLRVVIGEVLSRSVP